MIVLIEAGCAECRGWDDEPLVAIHEFDDIDAAKAWANKQGWLTANTLTGEKQPLQWKAHPQGGEEITVSQGSVWITPLTTPGRMFEEYQP